jgi:hypothetical protein
LLARQLRVSLLTSHLHLPSSARLTRQEKLCCSHAIGLHGCCCRNRQRINSRRAAPYIACAPPLTPPTLLLLLLLPLPPLHQQQTSCLLQGMHSNTDTNLAMPRIQLPPCQLTNPTHLFLWNLGFVLS